MAWELKIDKAVFKELKKFPANNAKRLIEVIENLPFNPFFGDLQKMHGKENVWRRRIGSYRLFFELYTEQKIIFVYWVERRTSKTY